MSSVALSADGCTVGLNCVSNATFAEGTDPLTGMPQGWSTNIFGSSDAQFVVTPGRTDSASVSVAVTSHNGANDAKWVFNQVPVVGGQYFVFGDWYKSTGTSEVYAYFDGGAQPYVRLVSLPPSETPDTWTELKLRGFFVPPGATAMTIAHVLIGNGSLTTDDYSTTLEQAPVFPQGMVSLTFDDAWKSVYENAIPVLDRAGLASTQYVNTLPVVLSPERYSTNMTVADVLAMQRSGHEIGSHTRSHPNLVDDIKDDDGLKAEIGGSQADLMRVGIATVDTFAYPYGQHDQRVRRIVADHFIAARTTEAGFNTTVEDRFALKSQSVVTTTTPAELRAWTDYAIANRVWLILTLHRVEPDLADCVRFGTEEADPECTDVATLQSIVDYLKGLPEGTVRTVREIVSDDALWATPPSDPPR